MCFADQYLNKQQVSHPQNFEKPSNNLGSCIVIPCYNEDKLNVTLNSLWECKRPGWNTEVIVVVNSSESDREEILKRNRETINEFELWEKDHRDQKLRFYMIHTPNLPEKHAGAGYARKTGMDIAVSRFNLINHPDAIIISLDADCTCSDNYLTEIETVFAKHKKADCGILYFEHPLAGQDYTKEVYEAVTQYELHLRYHIEFLRFIGYPYAYHTVGSCFAVRAKAYVKQGGMNRKKAGEDFYFLHKIFAAGITVEINNVTINPSPRPSERVIFGTGPVIKRLSENSTKSLNTFNPQAYNDLKQMIDIVPDWFEKHESQILSEAQFLPESIAQYVLQNGLRDKVKEIKRNTGSKTTFVKRFYSWFNPLMVVKYLNYAHQKYFYMPAITDAAKTLLEILNYKQIEDLILLELLKIYREQHKKNQIKNYLQVR